MDYKGVCDYFHYKRAFVPKDSHGLDIIDDAYKQKPVIVDAVAVVLPDTEDPARLEAVNSA
jgi:hypothetical protein